MKFNFPPRNVKFKLREKLRCMEFLRSMCTDNAESVPSCPERETAEKADRPDEASGRQHPCPRKARWVHSSRAEGDRSGRGGLREHRVSSGSGRGD